MDSHNRQVQTVSDSRVSSDYHECKNKRRRTEHRSGRKKITTTSWRMKSMSAEAHWVLLNGTSCDAT